MPTMEPVDRLEFQVLINNVTDSPPTADFPSMTGVSSNGDLP
jgi:hypothetical protein